MEAFKDLWNNQFTTLHKFLFVMVVLVFAGIAGVWGYGIGKDLAVTHNDRDAAAADEPDGDR